MHLRIDRDVLLQAVSYTTKAIPARTTQPIYSGLLLEAAAGKLTLSAFDNGNMVAATAVVDADVETDGRCLLPGRLLADIVKYLPNDTVTLSPEDNRVRLTCGKSKFVLPAMPVEDYPSLPVQPGRSGVISADVLIAVINQVEVATAGNDGIPMLTGIRVEIEGEKMFFVATDRYRLAVREVSWRPDDPSIRHEMILPAKALRDAAKGLHGDGAELTLGLNADGLFGLTGSTRTTVMGTIAEQYVNWRALLTAGNTTATVNAAEFANALAAASAAKAKSDPVRVTFGAEQFTVAAGGEDGSGELVIAGSYDGPEMTVGFNPEFLRDGVLASGTDEVQLSLTTPLKPSILTGKGGGTEFRYLVMPVRLPG